MDSKKTHVYTVINDVMIADFSQSCKKSRFYTVLEV